jgi:hypothetical protein
MIRFHSNKIKSLLYRKAATTTRRKKTPRVVFTFGGPGSGKSFIANKLYPHHEIVDSDKIKEEFPLYTEKIDEQGMYGTSGPATYQEFLKYPEDKRKATEEFISTRTPFKSVKDYFGYINSNPALRGKPLTHAYSSAKAFQDMLSALRYGKDVVFSSTGGKKALDLSRIAEELGYKPNEQQFLHVLCEKEEAWKRNLERPRSLDRENFEEAFNDVEDYVRTKAKAHATEHGMPLEVYDNSAPIIKPPKTPESPTTPEPPTTPELPTSET